MAFRIVEIIDTKPEGVVAKVSHQSHQMTVVIPHRRQEEMTVGASLQAEVGFDRIVDWKTIENFDDTRSGIWQDEDGVHLLGRIHSVLDYGDGKTIVDVYIRNGPEIFQIDAEAIENAELEANGGLEITVGNLYIYPYER